MIGIRILLRIVGTIAIVVIAGILLIEGLANLTWHLSGAGNPNPEKINQITALSAQIESARQRSIARSRMLNNGDPRYCPRLTKYGVVHDVAEWQGDRNFGEAPMLTERVRRGELPPVEERLPENPLVVVPPEQIGPYGGSWTRFATGPSDIGVFEARLAYDGLVRWGPLAQRVLPNLAYRWEITDNGKTFTFWLRRGVRWSDGHPFTVDDILFWYHHILLNTDLTPSIPPEFSRNNRVMEIDKLDDYTVRFRFAEPHGLFLKLLASGSGYEIVRYPAHYLKQYHPDFTPEEKIVEIAKKSGFDLWYQLFHDKTDWRNPEIPRLWPWIVIKPPPAQPAVFERNPYYWKVDPEGNQLPYIDRMTFEIYDAETINLKAINGEMGMQGRHMLFSNYPLFKEHSQKRGYRVLPWISSGGGDSVLALNLNHKDPILREIIRDRRFRIALSHAINRQEINELGYFGIGKPRQMAPPISSLFYCPEYESAYIEYDPAKANALLDEMGLSRRNKEGIRLRPDGKPLKLTIELASVFLNTAIFQLVADAWTAVGVKTDIKLEARQLFYTRKAALMHDVGVWGSADELIPVMDPRWFLPFSAESIHAIDYARWYRTNGKRGEKPTGDILRCIELYRRIERTPDEQDQISLFRQIIDLNRKNLWVIGIVGDIPLIFLVNENFRNVPEVAVGGWVPRTPGNTAPECYAIDQHDTEVK